MKIGEKYLVVESCAGRDCSYSQGEIVTLDSKNILWCESIIRSGLMVEVEKVETEEQLQEAISSGEELKVVAQNDDTELFSSKKNEEETLPSE